MVRKISVEITTSFAKGASTDGDVFLGLGGREFRLDIADHEDFGDGDETTYEFGEGANVSHPERNDPRRGLPLELDHVTSRPVYIRLDAHDGADDWNVANVRVRVQATDGGAEYSALDGGSENIWLGKQSGSVLHLHRA